jgi:hypothetical protein
LADRLDSKVRGFEATPSPPGLNVIDLLTIFVVVILLTFLLQASLAKQGYTLAGPWNWARTTAIRVAQMSFGTATADARSVVAEAPSPPSPVLQRVHAVRTRISPTERINNKTATRATQSAARTLPDAPASDVSSPWAKSDEVELSDDAG